MCIDHFKIKYCNNDFVGLFKLEIKKLTMHRYFVIKQMFYLFIIITIIKTGFELFAFWCTWDVLYLSSQSVIIKYLPFNLTNILIFHFLISHGREGRSRRKGKIKIIQVVSCIEYINIYTYYSTTLYISSLVQKRSNTFNVILNTS